MPAGEPSPPTEALRRERLRVRRLRVLLVLTLAGAGVLAVLWRDAVAESRRLEAERAQVESARQRELARLAEERGRALAAQVDAERARADANAALRREEKARRDQAVVEYARAVQLAHQSRR